MKTIKLYELVSEGKNQLLNLMIMCMNGLKNQSIP